MSTIISDHKNLVDIDRELHRCSLSAYLEWVSEVAEFVHLPNVRLLWGAGAVNLADFPSRLHSGVRIAKEQWETAISSDIQQVLDTFFPPVRDTPRLLPRHGPNPKMKDNLPTTNIVSHINSTPSSTVSPLASINLVDAMPQHPLFEDTDF